MDWLPDSRPARDRRSPRQEFEALFVESVSKQD